LLQTLSKTYVLSHYRRDSHSWGKYQELFKVAVLKIFSEGFFGDGFCKLFEMPDKEGAADSAVNVRGKSGTTEFGAKLAELCRCVADMVYEAEEEHRDLTCVPEWVIEPWDQFAGICRGILAICSPTPGDRGSCMADVQVLMDEENELANTARTQISASTEWMAMKAEHDKFAKASAEHSQRVQDMILAFTEDDVDILSDEVQDAILNIQKIRSKLRPLALGPVDSLLRGHILQQTAGDIKDKSIAQIIVKLCEVVDPCAGDPDLQRAKLKASSRVKKLDESAAEQDLLSLVSLSARLMFKYLKRDPRALSEDPGALSKDPGVL